MSSPNLVAKGNILPSRFVKFDGTNDYGVIQGTANARVAGIASEAGRECPLPSVSTMYAAQSGDPIHVYGDGEQCLLELNDTVVPGAVLKSDGNGYGVNWDVTGTTTQEGGAVALQGGVAGDKIRVQVKRSFRGVGVGTPA